MTGEFEIISEIFAPLSDGAAGAFGLTDDAALVTGGDKIITKDLMIEGVHFRSADPLDRVARKLLRVNLSDLAAKGSKPIGYLLACAWSASATEADIALFARGLAADQKAYRVRLFGGDTTRHRAARAPMVFSATFFGDVHRQGMVMRSGAAPGDDLYVSGTIGDAGLGLRALDKHDKFPKADRDYVVSRYLAPEPRLTLGGALPGVASAAIDVSDGLLADAGHLAETSGCAARIEAGMLPLSAPARAWAARQGDEDAAYASLASAGDDYELLFAAPARARRAIEMAATVSKTPVARIGAFEKGEGVRLIGATGEAIDAGARGYDHFKG